MLTVFEIVHNYINIIMLVKENFDSNIAPIRAWVAQMELDNMKKKITMESKSGLEQEKKILCKNRYSYFCINVNIHIAE